MKFYIGEILIDFGIHRTYAGHHALLHSVLLAIEDEMRLLNVMKEIYVPVAEILNCKTECIERNIRTVIGIAWSNHKLLFNHIAGFELNCPPTASEFIDMLASYAARNYNK